MTSPKIGLEPLVDRGPLILIRDCWIQGWGCGRHPWASFHLDKRRGWPLSLSLSSLGRSYAQNFFFFPLGSLAAVTDV